MRVSIARNFTSELTVTAEIFQRQIIKTGLAGSLMEPGSTGGKSDAFTLEEVSFTVYTIYTADSRACV